VGKFLSLVFGGFRLLMPFLFNGELPHGSLPDVLKAGCWANFALNKLAKGAASSIAKNEIIPLGNRPIPKNGPSPGSATAKVMEAPEG
jgi:hypothetical protein